MTRCGGFGRLGQFQTADPMRATQHAQATRANYLYVATGGRMPCTDY
jgi:hypothetical protein